MNRTAICSRTARHDETALDWQVQVLQDRAAALNLGVTHTIRDTDSGHDFKRRGLNKLLDLGERHEIDTMLMTNLNRIDRDTLKVLAVLEALDKHGVKIIIQGGDTVEASDPLCAVLRRFAPHQSLEVVLASTIG